MMRNIFRTVPVPFPSSARISILCLIISLTLFTGIVVPNDVQKADGDSVASLIKRGEKLVRKGSYVEAERLFRQALQISPNNSDAKLSLAYLQVKQRNLIEAYNLSLAVAQAEPKNAHAFAVLGVTMLAAGRFSDAKTMLANAIGLNKREALAWAGYGMLDFYENRIFDSIDRLKNAVYQDPNEADYIFALAQVSARAEKYKEAADAYNMFLLVADKTDDERRERIKGLINFLRYLGQRESLYIAAGDEQTSVPINIIGNRPVIQMRINDKPETFNFVLDTGSGISVISDKTAARLKIKPITRGGFAKGIGGDGKFEIVYGFLRQVAIGGVKLKNVPVYIREFHTGTEEVDGYIGLSLISKFLTTLDYGNLTFSLQKKDSNEAPLIEADAISLPLRLTSSGFLSGEVQLEGIESPLNFIVDTGASISVISDEIAGRNEVSPFLKEEKMRVIGSAGVTEDVRTFLLPRVSFGQHSRKSITAIALDLNIINEASGFQQAGILGGNFLRNYRLTFDFKNSMVTFVPISQEK